MSPTDVNSYMNQLGVLGEEVNSDYLQLALNNVSNYLNTNNSTVQELVNAINQNLAELNLIQNQLSTVNNLNQEALVKKDQLLRMENDDLMKQLRELETIQSTITNKDRLIDQTNNNIESQNQNIKILVSSIALAIILLVAILLFGFGKIAMSLLILIVIIILVLYFLLYIYSYNIFYFKDAITMLFDRRAQKMGYELNKWSTTIKTNVNNEIDSLKQNWIDQNCLCPASTSEEASSDSTMDGIGNNVNEEQVIGYYYYDASSPAQLLVPEPTPNMRLNEKIDWVDYSPDGNSKYNALLNKTINVNNNYYNYNSSNDPVNIQLKELEASNLLVNDQTYTGNI
jgi:hypothetical protein